MPELQQLNAKHQRMLELYLEGFKPGEIAASLGVTREGVTWVIASSAFQSQLARRRSDRENVHDQMVASTVARAREKLASASEVAADKLIEHLDSQDSRISMMAVKEILDRGCGGGADKGGIQVNILSAERVQLLLQSINEAGHGSLIDQAQQAKEKSEAA